MALFEIPVTSNFTDYDQEVDLNGVIYTLHFYYLRRQNAWFFDVLRGADDPIVYGVRIFSSFPLNIPYSRFSSLGRRFFAFDLNEEKKDAEERDFGTRILFYYDDGND